MHEDVVEFTVVALATDGGETVGRTLNDFQSMT